MIGRRAFLGRFAAGVLSASLLADALVGPSRLAAAQIPVETKVCPTCKGTGMKAYAYELPSNEAGAIAVDSYLPDPVFGVIETRPCPDCC